MSAQNTNLRDPLIFVAVLWFCGGDKSCGWVVGALFFLGRLDKPWAIKAASVVLFIEPVGVGTCVSPGLGWAGGCCWTGFGSSTLPFFMVSTAVVVESRLSLGLERGLAWGLVSLLLFCFNRWLLIRFGVLEKCKWHSNYNSFCYQNSIAFVVFKLVIILRTNKSCCVHAAQCDGLTDG